MRLQSGLIIPRSAYKTYAIRASRKTHHRRATCEEVQCPAFLNGWNFTKEDLSPDELYLAMNSGRRYKEVSVEAGKTLLVYESGQRCFGYSKHTVPLDKPAWFYGGMGRGNTFLINEAKKYDRPDQWMDDLHTDTDKAVTAKERG